jgi:hypothetical protein
LIASNNCPIPAGLIEGLSKDEGFSGGNEDIYPFVF